MVSPSQRTAASPVLLTLNAGPGSPRRYRRRLGRKFLLAGRAAHRAAAITARDIAGEPPRFARPAT